MYLTCPFPTCLSLISNRSRPLDVILLLYKPNLIAWQVRQYLFPHGHLRLQNHLLVYGQVCRFCQRQVVNQPADWPTEWQMDQPTKQTKIVFSKKITDFALKPLVSTVILLMGLSGVSAEHLYLPPVLQSPLHRWTGSSGLNVRVPWCVLLYKWVVATQYVVICV